MCSVIFTDINIDASYLNIADETNQFLVEIQYGEETDGTEQGKVCQQTLVQKNKQVAWVKSFTTNRNRIYDLH